MIHVDYCFLATADTLVVTGWGDNDDIGDIRILTHKSDYPAQHCETFKHPEVSLTNKSGYCCFFDSTVLNLDQLDEIHVLSKGKILVTRSSASLPSERESFLSRALNVFTYGTMRGLIAISEASNTGGSSRLSEALPILESIASVPRPFSESSDGAISIDRFIMSSAGLCLAEGWELDTGAGEIKVLLTNGKSIKVIKPLLDQIRREDLEGLADRFVYSGVDGFVCVFSDFGDTDDELKIIVLQHSNRSIISVNRTVERLPYSQLASEAVRFETRGKALEVRRSIAEMIAQKDKDLELPTLDDDGALDAPPVILLDHDLNDAFLSDVVDSLTASIGDIAQLIILRKPSDQRLNHQIGKIESRISKNRFSITINCDPAPQHIDPAITEPDASSRPLVFMRSSAALQIPNWREALDQIDGPHGAIVPCDPQGPMLDAKDTLIADTVIVTTNLASWCMMSRDRSAPFLTHEGRLRKLLVLAERQEQLRIRNVPVDRLFMGYGGVSQVHMSNGETVFNFDLRNHVSRERWA